MTDRAEERNLLRYALLAALWLPLFVALFPLLAREPLTSAGEDRVLALGVALLPVVLLASRRKGLGGLLSVLPAGVWTFLFVVAARPLNPERILELGWLSVVWFFLVAGVVVAIAPPRQKSLPWRIFGLAAAALAASVVFLLVSDMILVVLQTTAIPIAVPRFWMERVGYLWPLLFGAVSALLLGGRHEARRTALTGFFLVLVFLGVRQWQWRQQILAAYEQTVQAIQAGRSDLVHHRLEEIRTWNERKQLPGLEPKLRLLLAEWNRDQGRPLAVYFQVSRGIEEAPGRAGEFLDLLGPEVLNALGALPLNRYHNLKMTVDLEPANNPGQFYMLDRWGRVWLHSGNRIEDAFGSEGRQPIVGEDPADLEIVSDGRGAVILTKRGTFHFRGEVPPSIVQLLQSRRAPAQTYVDFELASDGKSVYLLSDRGSILQWGEKQIDITDDQAVQWPYSIARDLELSPDGRTLYLMDGLGKVHCLGAEGGIPTDGDEQPYWPEERAVDIERHPSGEGFYLLANYGGVYFVGGDQQRRKHRVPDAIQPIEDWPYAVALRILEDGHRLAILTTSGGIRFVQLQEDDPERWLLEIDRLMQERRFLQAVGLVDRLAAYAPGLVPEAVARFDADFCRTFSRMELDPDPDLAYWVAVAAEQVRPGEQTLIVDRWGRLWMEEAGDYSLWKDLTIFDLETGPATDVVWIRSASAALILYDNGTVEPWGPVPPELVRMLDASRPEGEGWVSLQLTPDGRGLVAACAFGGFHAWGKAPRGLPVREDFRWGDVPIGKAIAFGPLSNTLYFLDGHGVIHPFGDSPVFTKPPTAPYWHDDIARALAPASDEKDFLIMNRYGQCPTLRSATGELAAGVSRIRASSDYVDLACDADWKTLTFLERNFRVTHRFLGSDGVEKYVRRLEAGRKTDFSIDLLEDFHFGLQAASDMSEVKRIAAALPPEWFIRAAGLLSAAELEEDQLTRWVRCFENYGGLFADLELSPDGPGAILVDRIGRLYRFTPDREIVLEVIDPEPIEWVRTSRPVDLEPFGSGWLVLFEDGRVFSKGAVPAAAQVLAASLEANPIEDAMDLEIAPDGRGCVVMDRQGRLFGYGHLQVEDYQLEQMGWDDYEIARDLEWTADGRGLFLLDGIGSIHRIGRTDGAAPEERLGPPPWFGEDIATAMTPPDGRSALVLDRFGRLHVWGESAVAVPADQAFLPWMARGERLLDVERNEQGEIYLLTNWGRVDFFRPGEAGSEWHRNRFEQTRCPLEQFRQLHLAVTARPDRATQFLGSIPPEQLMHLSGGFADLPTDFFAIFRQRPTLVSLLLLFTDLKPSGHAGDSRVFLLDRWGRVLLTDPARLDSAEVLKDETIDHPAAHRAVALAVVRTGGESDPAFLVTDNRGNLQSAGALPPVLLEGMPDRETDLEDVVDLALSSDGQAAYLLRSDGRVVFSGRSLISPEQLPGKIWPPGTAVALIALSPTRGLYLLDAFGAVHAIGDVGDAPIGGHWFGHRAAAGLCADPDSEGLYLAGRDGRIFALGSASSIPDVFQPADRMTPGEQMLRLVDDPVGHRLLGWTSLNRLFEIPVGQIGSRIYFEKADQLLDATPAAALHTFQDALKMNPPLEQQRRIDEFSPRLVQRLLDLPEWQCGPLSFWVSASLPENDPGIVWLLNRWGEIYSGAVDSREYVRLKTATRPGVEPVGFLPVSGDRPGALLLYRDGWLEQWGAPVSNELQQAIEDYRENPVLAPTDLAWTPDRTGFYILSDRGRVRPIGQCEADLSSARFWYWEEPMAQSIRVTPDGRAIYLFDRLGGIHVSGPGPVNLHDSRAPYFSEPGLAADLCFSADGTTLFFLDAFGAIHTIGNHQNQPEKDQLPYFSSPAVLRLLGTETNQLVVVSCTGRLYGTMVSNVPEIDPE